MEKNKTQRIKNKLYRQFIDDGIIETLELPLIEKVVAALSGKKKDELAAFIIAMYFTGARPNELLRMKAQDVTLERTYVILKVPASKRGVPRPIYIPYKHALVKRFYKYATGLVPQMFLFYNLQGRYVRTYINKNGKEYKYIETSDKVRYHFQKAFEQFISGGIPPYFLRHNRFSKLSQKGLQVNDIMHLKGAKTLKSVFPYIHLSTAQAKKIGKHMD